REPDRVLERGDAHRARRAGWTGVLARAGTAPRGVPDGRVAGARISGRLGHVARRLVITTEQECERSCRSGVQARHKSSVVVLVRETAYKAHATGNPSLFARRARWAAAKRDESARASCAARAVAAIAANGGASTTPTSRGGFLAGPDRAISPARTGAAGAGFRRRAPPVPGHGVPRSRGPEHGSTASVIARPGASHRADEPGPGAHTGQVERGLPQLSQRQVSVLPPAASSSSVTWSCRTISLGRASFLAIFFFMTTSWPNGAGDIDMRQAGARGARVAIQSAA